MTPGIRNYGAPPQGWIKNLLEVKHALIRDEQGEVTGILESGERSTRMEGMSRTKGLSG